MDRGREKYACDECRTRKIQCTRNIPCCQRCVDNASKCIYSRSGVIRRNRKKQLSHETRAAKSSLSSSTRTPERPRNRAPESYDENDQYKTIERLNDDQETVVSRLSSVASPFWLDTDFVEMATRMRVCETQYFTFEEEAQQLTQWFASEISKARPIYTEFPDYILAKLATEPETIQERAYLVIFYGMLLPLSPSQPAVLDLPVSKLKWNLWLSINDASLLLEPSYINIQALLLLACHIQSFHTPTLCWMLTSSACRMFQCLPVKGQNVVETTQSIMFWFLNCLDKNSALIFGRPPNLHRSMCRQYPLPTMESLLEFKPHVVNRTQHVSLFGAHILQRMFLAAQITGDIWEYIHESEQQAPILDSPLLKRLDAWHAETQTVLEAALLSEKPLLQPREINQLQLGIDNMRFQYLHLVVMLLRGHRDAHSRCLQVSKDMLLCLPSLISDSADVYNGIVWQLLYCPFVALFTLIAQYKSESDVALRAEILTIMEILPQFLRDMIARHPLAKGLYDLARGLLHRLKPVEEQQSTALSRARRISRAKNAGTRTTPSISSNGITNAATASPRTEIPTPIGLGLTNGEQGAAFGKSHPILVHDPTSLDTMEPVDWHDLDGFDWFQWDSNDSRSIFQ